MNCQDKILKCRIHILAIFDGGMEKEFYGPEVSVTEENTEKQLRTDMKAACGKISEWVETCYTNGSRGHIQIGRARIDIHKTMSISAVPLVYTAKGGWRDSGD